MSKAGSYYDKVYQDEIESFSFSTRNNDGETFSASVPSQTATLVLNAKGDTLIDDTLEKGCYAAITSDATTPLIIIMMINEITNLKRKGRVEISLGRVTANTFNLTTHGVYTVDSQKVSDFVQEAGLKDYLFTDMDNEYLNNLVVNSKSVDDTIMAMAWSQNVRRNVTLLPAYCTPALSEPYRYNYSGVMLFTNKKKEQLSETNDFTQVYRVAASDIYDYTIEAAQPPVTEVKTAGSGLLGPVDADESTVFQYGEGVGTSDSMNTMSGYLLLGHGMTAQLYDRQRYTGDSNDYQIDGQTLVWSNGDKVNFAEDFQPNGIAGVYKDHFAGESMTDSNKIAIYDKQLNVVAEVDMSAYSGFKNAFSKIQLLAAPVEPFVPRKFMTYAFYNTTSNAEAEILFFNRPVVSTNRQSVALGIVHMSSDWRLLTVTTNAWPGSNVEIRALVPMSTTSGGAPEVLMPVYQQAYGDMNTFAAYVSLSNYTTKDIGYIMQSAPEGQFRILRDATMAEVFKGWDSTDKPKLAVLFYERGVNSMREAIVRGSVSSGATTLGLETAAYMQKYNKTFNSAVGSTYRKILAYDEYKWQEYYAQGTEETDYPLMMESKRGSTELWADSATVFYSYYKEYLAAFVFKGNNYWSLFGQVADNPFNSRMPADASVSTNIGDGTENAVDISFKVGNITMDDAQQYDATDGRIELEVAGISVKSTLEGSWYYAKAEQLPLPALSTYLYVALDPAQPSEYTTVKIIGCSIEYSGRVKLKISGMIVG